MHVDPSEVELRMHQDDAEIERLEADGTWPGCARQVVISLAITSEYDLEPHDPRWEYLGRFIIEDQIANIRCDLVDAIRLTWLQWLDEGIRKPYRTSDGRLIVCADIPENAMPISCEEFADAALDEPVYTD